MIKSAASAASRVGIGLTTILQVTYKSNGPVAKCTGEALDAPGRRQVYRGGAECTWEAPSDTLEAPNAPGRRRMQRGGAKCTGRALKAPAGRRMHRQIKTCTKLMQQITLSGYKVLRFATSDQKSSFARSGVLFDSSKAPSRVSMMSCLPDTWVQGACLNVTARMQKPRLIDKETRKRRGIHVTVQEIAIIKFAENEGIWESLLPSPHPLQCRRLNCYTTPRGQK